MNLQIEADRINFMIRRDGVKRTVEFAKQTAKIYRRCVVGRIGMCGDRNHRIRFIKSVLELRRFIKENTLC